MVLVSHAISEILGSNLTHARRNSQFPLLANRPGKVGPDPQIMSEIFDTWSNPGSKLDPNTKRSRPVRNDLDLKVI